MEMEMTSENTVQLCTAEETNKKSTAFMGLGKPLPGVPERCFFSGTKFKGVVKRKARVPPGRKIETSIQFQYVDRDNDYLCGIIDMTAINVGTSTSPFQNELTAQIMFEGEIIGEKYPFNTGRWNTNSEVDKVYWSYFPSFKKYSLEAFKSTGDSVNYKLLRNDNCVFMRWKENSKSGFCLHQSARSDGVHYVCLDKTSGIMETFYFQRKYAGVFVEDFSFQVKHVEQRSVPVCQIR